MFVYLGHILHKRMVPSFNLTVKENLSPLHSFELVENAENAINFPKKRKAHKEQIQEKRNEGKLISLIRGEEGNKRR